MAILNPNRIGGTIEFRIAGVAYAAAGEFEYCPSGMFTREPVVSESGFVAGYADGLKPAYIRGEIFDASTLNIAALANLDGVPVLLKLANGKIISGENLFYSGDMNANAKTGRLPVAFTPGAIGFIVEVMGV